MNCATNSVELPETSVDSLRLTIASQPDVLAARQKGREYAIRLGFAGSDVTVIAAAICEIARNMVDYAQGGEMRFSPVQAHLGRSGMEVVAHDEGPGIPDVNQALRYGCTTRKGLGVGLPGAKWLMDEFEIDSAPGHGTTVRMVKWLPE
jgi:serine/threonine-protein kinase RsbT